MKTPPFKTAITSTKPNEILLRGYPIEELMGSVDFGQAIYLLFRGDLPSPAVGKLITAMIVSSIDHGPTAPSVNSARLAASTGAPLNACVAAGVLNINRYHGGAIEDCARAILEITERAETDSISLEDATAKVLSEYRTRNYRVAGFGHPMHRADPRTPRLFELAGQAGVCGRFVETCRLIEAGLARQLGKTLPININGATSAVLLEMGFEPDVMNGLFMIARIPGLIAQAREEMIREKKMRNIDPYRSEYDGPAKRSVDKHG